MRDLLQAYCCSYKYSSKKTATTKNDHMTSIQAIQRNTERGNEVKKQQESCLN